MTKFLRGDESEDFSRVGLKEEEERVRRCPIGTTRKLEAGIKAGAGGGGGWGVRLETDLQSPAAPATWEPTMYPRPVPTGMAK
jgi:hypothetical protein